MRGLFTDLLVALLAVSGLMSPAVMAGDDIQCDPVEMAKINFSEPNENPSTFPVAIFGINAVMGSGNTGLVSGNAYVFEQKQDGSWLEIAKLTPSDNPNYSFGSSVAFTGTTALVGAYGDDDNGSASGSVYIFEQQIDGSWLETGKLTASDGKQGDYFGYSVAISGTTAFVGAHGNDGTGDDSGSVYVFEQQDDGTWLEITKLTASDADHWESFGYSVDISGTTAVIGAYADDDIGDYSGSAYIFEQQEDGTWLETAKLIASDAEGYDFFSKSVAISGTIALIGSSFDDDNGSQSGSAYIFEQQIDGSWLETAKLLASDGASSDYFGYSVAISGTTAVIGAYEDDDIGDGSGSAYMFERQEDGTWFESAKLLAANSNSISGFGDSVAISGRTVVVSTRGDLENENNTGSAYIFKTSDGLDCNGNGICDVADFVDGFSQDCNLNDIPDECDIADGTSSDTDNNGIPDGCALQCSLISFDLGYDGEQEWHSAGLEVVINEDIAAVLQDTGERLEIQLFHQADGIWTLEATRVLADPFTTQSWYPRKSLDISGSTIIAGLYTSFWNGFAIFNRRNGVWIEEVSVNQYTEEADDTYFALSVSISEDVAVIGRPNINGDVHSAIVYRRMGDTWFQEAILTNPFDPTDQWFGTEVAVDGNTIMVTGLSSPVTVYEHDGSSWNPIQYIENNGIPFSSTIDVQGDVAFVGTFAGDYKDRVQVLNRVDGQWELGQSLTPIDPNDFGFGYAVRLDGDRAIVTSGLNYFGDPELGKVHVFQLENGQWSEIETLLRPDLPGSWLNSPRISLSGNQIAVAYIDDGSTGFSEVTLFNLNSDDEANDIDCNGNTYCDALDISLGISQDCDGNGVPDDCDLNDGLYLDVDLDGIPDICESDCNENLIPDDSELEQGKATDCNGNGIPDSCDIAFNHSPDTNDDGIPDECDSAFVITVASDGSGLYTDIQSAIDLAMPSSTISVASGIYLGPIVLPGYDLQLVSKAGPESTLIIGSTGSPAMVIGTGHTGETTVDGFTLTGCDVTGTGGGLVIAKSSPVVRNCIMTNNKASRGGGIFISESNPLIEGCRIFDNQAKSGGGIAIEGRYQTDEPVRIIGCTLENNVATEASYAATNRGGGGIASTDAILDIQDTEFIQNDAFIWGGAFEFVSTTTVILNNLFESNSSGISSANLGVSFLGSNTSLQNCTLCNHVFSEINGPWQDLGDNVELDVCECPDTNGDDFVDVDDVLIVIDAWGDCVPDQACPADVDGDGLVNVNDILLVISEWGPCK